MAALGPALFVCDSRSAGQSKGGPGASDFSQLADDAIAAKRMLALDPRIDAKQIGV
jgi:hypothetical protein